MRTAVVLLILVASALAQDHAAVVAAESACGPAHATFNVSTGAFQHPTPQPDSDKALVFVAEDLGQCGECRKGLGLVADVRLAVVKVGADGAWIGANQGNSYLYFSVAPGEHHFCVNWQSRLSGRSLAFAMAGLLQKQAKSITSASGFSPLKQISFSISIW